jgi:hypothetical protein
MMRSDLQGAALRYAARGMAVFPCVPGMKHPMVEHGFHDATIDADVVREWWGRWPRANVAMPTGGPGFDVVDVDVHPSGDGYAHLRRLRAAGLLDGWTHVVRTPSGGVHVYFPGTDQRNGSVPAAHIDFRASGGYVLVPPSVVDGPDGPGRYRTVAVNSAPFNPVDWSAIRDALTAATSSGRHRDSVRVTGVRASPSQAARWLARHVANAVEGNRNAALFWASCRAVERGVADLSPLLDAACSAGLSEREAGRTIASARRTVTRQAPIHAGDQRGAVDLAHSRTPTGPTR